MTVRTAVDGGFFEGGWFGVWRVGFLGWESAVLRGPDRGTVNCSTWNNLKMPQNTSVIAAF